MFLTKGSVQLALKHHPSGGSEIKEPELAGNGSHVVYIHSHDKSISILLDELNEHGVIGRAWDGEVYRLKCCMPWRSLKKTNFVFKIHKESYIFTKKSIGSYLFSSVLHWDSLKVITNKIKQLIFNTRRLARKDRMQVLRIVFENSLHDIHRRFSAVFLVQEIYTDRAFLRPDKDRYINYIILVLDSLVASGELEKNGISYKITPRALETLSLYEEEERRHKDNVYRQKILAILTFALVVVGVVQIWIHFMESVSR